MGGPAGQGVPPVGDTVPDTSAALGPAGGAELLRLALAAVAARFADRPLGALRPSAGAGDGPLRDPGASFVTLEAAGRLRGCIGSLDAVRPLWTDVVRNAARAMRDPRMAPVTVAEWDELEVTVSVLSPVERLPTDGPEGLVAALRPGVDGLLLADGHRRATFLPSVWAKLPESGGFLAALLAKGGWPVGSWPDRMVVYRYTTVEFRDAGPRLPVDGSGAGGPGGAG